MEENPFESVDFNVDNLIPRLSTIADRFPYSGDKTLKREAGNPLRNEELLLSGVGTGRLNNGFACDSSAGGENFETVNLNDCAKGHAGQANSEHSASFERACLEDFQTCIPEISVNLYNNPTKKTKSAFSEFCPASSVQEPKKTIGSAWARNSLTSSGSASSDGCIQCHDVLSSSIPRSRTANICTKSCSYEDCKDLTSDVTQECRNMILPGYGNQPKVPPQGWGYPCNGQYSPSQFKPAPNSDRCTCTTNQCRTQLCSMVQVRIDLCTPYHQWHCRKNANNCLSSFKQGAELQKTHFPESCFTGTGNVIEPVACMNAKTSKDSQFNEKDTSRYSSEDSTSPHRLAASNPSAQLNGIVARPVVADDSVCYKYTSLQQPRLITSVQNSSIKTEQHQVATNCGADVYKERDSYEAYRGMSEGSKHGSSILQSCVISPDSNNIPWLSNGGSISMPRNSCINRCGFKSQQDETVVSDVVGMVKSKTVLNMKNQTHHNNPLGGGHTQSLPFPPRCPGAANSLLSPMIQVSRQQNGSICSPIQNLSNLVAKILPQDGQKAPRTRPAKFAGKIGSLFYEAVDSVLSCM